MKNIFFLAKISLAVSLFTFILFSSIIFYIYYKLTLTDKNLDLNQQLHRVVSQLESFKDSQGHYPNALIEAGIDTDICVTHFVQHCRQLRYKPIDQGKSFRLAVKSLTWRVFYFHPDYSITTENLKQMTQEAIRGRNDHGFFCTMCFAAPEGRDDLIGSNPSISFPIYRETPPVFSNPNEWPEL